MLPFLISSVKQKWKNIAEKPFHTLPTQQYDYQRYLFWQFYSHPKRFLRYRIHYIYCRQNDEESILPIVVDRKSKRLIGLSHFGRLDYDDIIASNNNPSILKGLLRESLKHFHDYHIYIPNINEHSLLYIVLSDKLVFSGNCVSISFPDSYEEYIHNLSKHQQQNIRTSFNRLSRDGISFHLVKYDTTHQMPLRLWKSLCFLHHKRHKETISKLDLLRNPYYHILNKNKNRQTYVLYDGNKPMAYMAGLLSSNQETFYVPRLCINEEYAKYSPGIVLLCETVKQLISGEIKTIDLMIGDEPYKLAMGGIISKNYYLDCNVNELLK